MTNLSVANSKEIKDRYGLVSKTNYSVISWENLRDQIIEPWSLVNEDAIVNSWKRVNPPNNLSDNFSFLVCRKICYKK